MKKKNSRVIQETSCCDPPNNLLHYVLMIFIITSHLLLEFFSGDRSQGQNQIVYCIGLVLYKIDLLPMWSIRYNITYKYIICLYSLSLMKTVFPIILSSPISAIIVTSIEFN